MPTTESWMGPASDAEVADFYRPSGVPVGTVMSEGIGGKLGQVRNGQLEIISQPNPKSSPRQMFSSIPSPSPSAVPIQPPVIQERPAAYFSYNTLTGPNSAANVRAALGQGPISFQKKYQAEVNRLAGEQRATADREASLEGGRIAAGAQMGTSAITGYWGNEAARTTGSSHERAAAITSKGGVEQARLGLRGKRIEANTEKDRISAQKEMAQMGLDARRAEAVATESRMISEENRRISALYARTLLSDEAKRTEQRRRDQIVKDTEEHVANKMAELETTTKFGDDPESLMLQQIKGTVDRKHRDLLVNNYRKYIAAKKNMESIQSLRQ